MYVFLNFSMNITASEAATISSIASATYTAGRFASIFVSGFVSPANQLTGHFSLTLGCFVALLCWTQYTNQLGIQVNAGLIGFATSPIHAAMLR